MKTMTCQQLGGPCDTPFTAAKADDVIKAQDAHLKESVAAGDTTHAEAAKAMAERWKHPVRGMGWYRSTKKTFAALPEN
jgi:hypothetical protein